MSFQHDLVVRGGLVVDGCGKEPYPADVAVREGRIVQASTVSGRAREEIDARRPLVTPGFVDTHTRYYAEATRESRLMPSSFHGVTTVVIDDCGALPGRLDRSPQGART